MVEVGAIGYVHPHIDATKCIDCKLCQKVCPVVTPVEKRKPLQAFAAVAFDSIAINSSASGGAASTMARTIIEKGGVVYGCRMRNYTDIAHERFATLDDMNAMRGSKYVQSSIGFTFRQVKADLNSGLVVLFTGTACQIAGLRNFLHHEYDSLYCIDLVCHGVPSQKLLRDNVENMFRKKGLRPKGTERVTFRRIYSTQTSNLDLRFGTFVESAIPVAWQNFLCNTYITAFMYGLTFRDNCYHCPYACAARIADVTVADFWGYKGKAVPSGKGISLIMPNTAKGQRLVEMVKPFMLMEERPVSEAINGNGQLKHPSACPSERTAFISGYARYGEDVFPPLLRKYKWKYRINKVKVVIIKILGKCPMLLAFLMRAYNKIK